MAPPGQMGRNVVFLSKTCHPHPAVLLERTGIPVSPGGEKHHPVLIYHLIFFCFTSMLYDS